jgi:hypothetical protein
MRAKLISAILGAAALALPIAATAQVSVDVTIAPPAPQYEPMPPARPGWVWGPGHWAWANGRYVWEGGQWMAARPGYRWVTGNWEPRGPKWVWIPGHWTHI